MIVGRNVPGVLRFLESSFDSPAFCSVARRAAQASTSEASCVLPLHRNVSACSGIARSECTPLVGSGGLVLRTEFPLYNAAHSIRPLCTLGRASGLLLYEDTISNHSRVLHELQQQRHIAFGLPNVNGDTSKQYQERRLLG